MSKTAGFPIFSVVNSEIIQISKQLDEQVIILLKIYLCKKSLVHFIRLCKHSEKKSSEICERT